MTHDEYVKMLKDYVLKTATKKVVGLLISKFAILGWGPFGYITKIVVEKVIKKALYETEMGLFYAYTDFRVNHQGREFYNKLVKWNSEGQNHELEEDLINSFRKLIKFTN